MKKITIALVLFGALFSLTTNLMSQEKEGWFVGISPFSFIGAEIKTSTTFEVVAGTAPFAYQATIDSNFLNDTVVFPNEGVTDDEAKNSLIRGAIELCKRGSATTDRFLDANIPLDPNNPLNKDYPTVDTINFNIGYLAGQFDATNPDKTTEICHLPADINDIDADANVKSSKSLQGALAIQFGYNFEKYRVSLTSFSNKAGANRLTNNLLLADWFLAPGFYAGLGITNAKLETEIGSASKTAPAFNLGYARKIGNLQLEVGYLFLNSSFSIQKQTQLSLGSETQTLGETSRTRNRITGFGTTGDPLYHAVVKVTRTPVGAIKTKKVELQSQQVIYLRLVYGF